MSVVEKMWVATSSSEKRNVGPKIPPVEKHFLG